MKLTHAAVGCGHVTKDVDKIIFIGDLAEVDCTYCRAILRESDHKAKISKAPKGENGNRLALCHPCSVGAHSVCSAVFEGRWDAKCGCATCHPAEVPDNTVLEIFYALTYAVFASQGLGPNWTEQRDREIFTAVRVQFTDAPIEQWVNIARVHEAILAEGAKDYYSRDEVTKALVAAGLDMEWAKATPSTPRT